MVALNTLQQYRLYLLLAGYMICLLILDLGGLDIWFAAKLYQLQGNQWALQQHWLTEQWLHRGMRKLNYLLLLATFLTTLFYLFVDTSDKLRSQAYLALSLSLISALLLVAYFKMITNVACPWHLQLFGGKEPYFSILSARPDYLPYHKCFPAGHASIGYAWGALYYFFKATRPNWRWLGLAAGLSTGAILGLTQQIRGAHFMSHDLTTLVLCLLCARLSFNLMVFNRLPTKK